jgi:hypothetical protein
VVQLREPSPVVDLARQASGGPGDGGSKGEGGNSVFADKTIAKGCLYRGKHLTGGGWAP